MDQFQYLTEREKALLQSFPTLGQEELDRCNALFRGYLIYEREKGGRRVWTSCCHKKREWMQDIERTETPERLEVKRARHNDTVRCPWCGRTVTVKCRGRFRGRNAHERIAVVFLHGDGAGGIYAQAYITGKNYKDDPAGYPGYILDTAYHFRSGGATWFYEDFGGAYIAQSEEGTVQSRKKLREPFWPGGMCKHHENYKVIGGECIEESFARYCGRQRWRTLDAPGAVWDDDLMRWLLVAAIYPRQLEMLTKAGQRELINDLIWESRKNTKVFSWRETDPRKAFRMEGDELRLFLADGGGLSGLYARKLLGCRWEEAREWVTGADALPTYLLERFVKEAEEHGLTAKELRKYLLRFTGPRCYGGWFGLQQAQSLWEGYLRNAEAAGYDLTSRARLLPRDLFGEHDAVSAIVQRMREAEDAKKKQKLARAAKKREKELNEKYGFETEHFFIRAPHSMAEIIAEGRALEHCVGGYAERHADGKVTILFLRAKAEPKRPLCTIEVDGTRLVQIHGYRNERTPGSVEPEKRFAEIYRPWKRWLDGGAKRNKDGTPFVPKKKEAKTA